VINWQLGNPDDTRPQLIEQNVFYQAATT